MQENEPLWLQEDRDWALALLAEERDQCPRCGQPRSETYDPANGDAYTVDRIGMCAGCLVLDGAGKDLPDGYALRVRHKHHDH